MPDTPTNEPADQPGGYHGYFDERVLRLYRSLVDPAEARWQVGALVELLGLPVGARILDLGCGWGRHALPLAEAGFRVAGVDISGRALEEAARASRRQGLRVGWTRADMRSVPFRGSFDAALSLFSSLGFFASDEDDLRVLRQLRGAVRPGGLLVLETMHRDAFVDGFQAEERWEGVPEGPVRVERRFDALAGVNHERLVWPDGTVKAHAMRVRTATEWVALVERAGLSVETVHGGWDEEPVLVTSPVIVLLARRS